MRKRHAWQPVLLLPDGDTHTDTPPAAGTGAPPPAPGPDGAPDPATASPDPDRGYPENTPWTEMTDKQAAAYWRHQARKHEGTAKARGDYDDLKVKAAELEKVQRAQMSEHEKAVEAARTEGRQAALTDSLEKAAAVMLRLGFQARGKTDEQIAHLVEATNVRAFLTKKQDDVDADRLAAYVSEIAGPVTGGGRGPDHGQGTRGSTTRASGVSAGAEMFAAAHKRPAPTTS